MKKIISLLLAVVMIFALSACVVEKTNSTPSGGTEKVGTSPGDKNTVNDNVKDEAYTGQLPLTKEPVKLTFAVGFQGDTYATPSTELPVYQEYEKLTNVKVDWQVIKENFNVVIESRIAAGTDIPDMFSCPLAKAKEYYDSGAIILLDDLLVDNAPYTQKFYKDNTSERIFRRSDDGHRYFISGAGIQNANAVTVLMNQKWLDRLNHKAPQTFDELYDTLKLFKENDLNNNGQKDEIPMIGWYNRYSFDAALGDQFGLELSNEGFQLDENGKVVCDFIDPKYKEYLIYMNKLYKEQLINQKTFSRAETYEYAKNNTMGSCVTYSTFSGVYSGMSPEAESSEDAIFVPMDPIKGPYGHQRFIASVASPGSGTVISSSCKNKDIALRYVDFLFGHPEAIKLQNYGIEGATYDFVSGKIIPRKSPKDESFNSFVKTVGGGQPPFPHQQLLEAWKISYDKWVMDINDQQQKYFKMPEALRIYLTQEETEQRDKYWTDISKYIESMKTDFIFGNQPLDKFDEYVQTLKSMGIEEVLKVYQSRQDRAVRYSKME